MVASLERRGPDGYGIESLGPAVLGHRRLAIFDLTDAGRQPMRSADGRAIISFNGAIYNFTDLRKTLERAGRTFRSETDTEVLVEGYQEWGIDGLVHRIRGMFAFAIWDENRQRLFLVRDRLGQKPLAYRASAQGVDFASTTQALAHAGGTTNLNRAAVAEFLEFGCVNEHHSIYDGVTKLAPASILEWTPGAEPVTRRYWVLDHSGPFDDITYEKALDKTEQLFLDAVQVRLKADVPVGALLSGGIDSAILCWAVKELGADLTAFTVGVPDDPWDESHLAQRTARLLGLKHEILPLAAPSAEHLDEALAAYDEPFAKESAFGMLAISKTVRSSATVLLTGDGGDDIFLGYPRHKILRNAQRLAKFTPPGAPTAWTTLRGLVPRRGLLKRAASFADYIVGGVPAFLSANRGLEWLEERGILGAELSALRPREISARWSLSSARDSLSQYLPYHLSTQFVSEYLTKVDRATMYHGLEARSPLLDQHVWEFASRLPFDVRMKDGRLKALLRGVAERHIDRSTAREAKRGFRIPAQRWVVEDWADITYDYFSNSRLAERGWIEKEPLVDEFERARRVGRCSLQLWSVFVLEGWLRREAAQAAAPPLVHDADSDFAAA